MPPCYIMIYVMITLVLSSSFHANIIANMSYHVLHSAKIWPSSSRISHLKQMDGFQIVESTTTCKDSCYICHIPLSSPSTQASTLQGIIRGHKLTCLKLIWCLKGIKTCTTKGKFLQDCHRFVWFILPCGVYTFITLDSDFHPLLTVKHHETQDLQLPPPPQAAPHQARRNQRRLPEDLPAFHVH